jgi:hypothetical protein
MDLKLIHGSQADYLARGSEGQRNHTVEGFWRCETVKSSHTAGGTMQGNSY